MTQEEIKEIMKPYKKYYLDDVEVSEDDYLESVMEARLEQ